MELAAHAKSRERERESGQESSMLFLLDFPLISHAGRRARLGQEMKWPIQLSSVLIFSIRPVLTKWSIVCTCDTSNVHLLFSNVPPQCATFYDAIQNKRWGRFDYGVYFSFKALFSLANIAQTCYYWSYLLGLAASYILLHLVSLISLTASNYKKMF